MVNNLARKRSNRYKLKAKNKSSRLRLSVYRSSQHIYAQLIDDTTGCTVVSSSSVLSSIRQKSDGISKLDVAVLVGKDLGSKINQQDISSVYFDRGSFIFHGRVKALADAVRSLGVIF